jgi:hypothetical protein
MSEMRKYYIESKKERNILHTVKRRKANWIGHILRRNCLLKQTVEEKTGGGIKVTGRQVRRYKQLLDHLNETKEYCKLKFKTPDRTGFRRGCGPVVRHTAV